MGNTSERRRNLLLPIAGWVVAALLAAMLFVDASLRVYRIGPGDKVQIFVLGTLPDNPIAGDFDVEDDGFVKLGQTYGDVPLTGLTPDEAKAKVVDHLKMLLTAPEVSVRLLERNAHLEIRRALPAVGWALCLVLVLLLALTTVRTYTVPEPRRRGVQFSLATMLWIMVIVALALFAFNERRERLKTEARDFSRPTVSPYL
ncbi:MAG TPA: polysaccharide biosynthesis/export family protein [Pirellulales bacterium]|jgi:hypothetical protein